MSKKRIREGAIYSKRRRAFLKEKPVCEACVYLNPEFRPSCDVHHKAGRLNGNYLDRSTWIAVCRPCHDWIHAHPKEARALNLLQ